jgi:hypothetical protein
MRDVRGWGRAGLHGSCAPLLEDRSEIAATLLSRLGRVPSGLDVETRSRLQSILSVLKHEGGALGNLDDDRLFDVLAAMHAVRLEIEATLHALEQPPGNGR